MQSKSSQSIILKDGRVLGYAEYGDLRGRPIFFFHGQPGNRLFCHPHHAIAESLGARVIAVDRPGYGLSTYQPGRRLLDWSQDVMALADSLGLDRFACLGFSAGGPYSAACARQIPYRLTQVGLVSSAAPIDIMQRVTNGRLNPLLRLNGLLFQYAPWLARVLFSLYWRRSQRYPEEFIRLEGNQLSPADRAIMNRPEISTMLLETWKENVRVECRGYVEDAKILMGDWGFSFTDIVMKVHLWQGEADTNIPPTIAREIASQLPNCKAIFYPGEGHLAIFTHWKEILCLLVGENPV